MYFVEELPQANELWSPKFKDKRDHPRLEARKSHSKEVAHPTITLGQRGLQSTDQTSTTSSHLLQN